MCILNKEINEIKKQYFSLIVNDSLQLFHDPPSETEVAFYIEQCLSFVYYFYSSDIKRWWIFLCNYARNVLQDITFHDGSKSLNEYKQELFFQNETFKIRNLIDILHNPNYNGNTEYVNIILKRYICTRKFQVHVIGFNLNSTDDINVLLDQPQINNNFGVLAQSLCWYSVHVNLWPYF